MQDLDQKIRWGLIKLLKDNKTPEAEELFKKSYIDNQAKRIELGYFYTAIKMNFGVVERVNPSTIEEQVIKHMEIK